MTGYETIMVELLTRMAAGPALAAADSIRRAHRTAIPKGAHSAIHVIDGLDRRVKGSPCGRECFPSVALFARSDDGVGATDTQRAAVFERLAAAWPSGIKVTIGAITPDTEIADTDVVRVDIDLEITYGVASPFSLDLAA